MILLLASLVIALSMILLGMWIMSRAGRHVNMDRLQVFIAVATGFMMAILFLDLLPENIEVYPSGARSFFQWSLLGMGLVIVFERYGVPRLRFVDRFFSTDQETLRRIETHDEHVHESHGQEVHSHHEHHDLEEATHCAHSHEHGHLHQHTHLEVLGHGEVCSAIACFMICAFFDGVALSSVQAVDQKLGVILVIGVILHLLPEGVLSGAMALAGGASVRSAQKVLFFIGGAFLAGSLIPHIFKGFESTFLALSTGILIFVTLVQLLPTALKLRFAPGWIFAGAGVYYGSRAVLVLLGVHS